MFKCSQRTQREVAGYWKSCTLLLFRYGRKLFRKLEERQAERKFKMKKKSLLRSCILDEVKAVRCCIQEIPICGVNVIANLTTATRRSILMNVNVYARFLVCVFFLLYVTQFTINMIQNMNLFVTDVYNLHLILNYKIL